MNSSNYADANHEAQSCNLTHLIYGWQPNHCHQHPPHCVTLRYYSAMFSASNHLYPLGIWPWHRLTAANQPWVYDCINVTFCNYIHIKYHKRFATVSSDFYCGRKTEAWQQQILIIHTVFQYTDMDDFISMFPHYGVATAVIQLAKLILANNEDSGCS